MPMAPDNPAVLFDAAKNEMPNLEVALKPIVEALPKEPELPDNIGDFL